MVSVIIESITSSTTVDPNFEVFFIDASSGNLTLTLPEINSTDGINFKFMRIDTTSNIVTIQGYTPTETINGHVSITMSITNIALLFVSYGNVWYNCMSGVLPSIITIPYSGIVGLSLTLGGGGGTANNYATINSSTDIITATTTTPPTTTTSTYFRAARAGTFKKIYASFSGSSVGSLGGNTLSLTLRVYVAPANSGDPITTAPTFALNTSSLEATATVTDSIISSGSFFTTANDITDTYSCYAGDLIAVELYATITSSGSLSVAFNLTVAASIEFI